MAWGDPGVTELQVLKDNSLSFSAINATPTGASNGIVTLQHVGLLRRLRIRLNVPFSTVAASATAPTLDVNGPWDMINLFRADVNGIAPLYAVSGMGAFLISLASNPSASVDAQTSAIATDPSPFSDVYQFPTVTTSSASYQMTGYLDLPFSIDLSLPSQTQNIPSELGLWLLQNQATDLNLTLALNPLNGSTPGYAPYQGGTGLTYSYTAATVDFEREMYRIPSDPANMPNLQWALQWTEKLVPFSGTSLDLYIDRAGVLLQTICYVVDSATNDGVATAKVQDAQFVYGTNETPYNGDPGFTRARQLRDWGRLFTKGCYQFDPYQWTGSPFNRIGSFKLVYNTETIINQRMHFDFTSSLASGSYVRMLTQRLIPIVANRTATPVGTSGAPVGASQGGMPVNAAS